MRRGQLYALLVVVFGVLNFTVFFLELPTLREQPFAYHWVPEVLAFLFLGMLVTAAGDTVSHKVPHARRKVGLVLLLCWVVFGSLHLGANFLLHRAVWLSDFACFILGAFLLFGYGIETQLTKGFPYKAKQAVLAVSCLLAYLLYVPVVEVLRGKSIIPIDCALLAMAVFGIYISTAAFLEERQTQ